MVFFYIVLAFVATCYAGPASNTEGSISLYQCRSKNGYFVIEGSCDSYIECRHDFPIAMSCPDGLHFNPAAKWPNYPCGYPADVPCLGTSAIQKAKSTPDCPHQYGIFPSPYTTPEDCGHYRICIEGRAMEMECPAGLAFNADSGRCDWPHLVASCDADAYLKFTCPDADFNDDKIENYKYPGDCFYFFSCQYGHARLLACDDGSAFDSDSGRCIDEELVHCEQH